MTDENAVREKIAKLMALGKDASANQYEAEAALRQAAFLMRKHNIEEAELCSRTGNKPVWKWVTVVIPVTREKCKVKKQWMGQLAVGIARLTDTKAVWKWNDTYGECVAFSGDEVDVQYAAWLARHLRDNVTYESKRYHERGSQHHLTKLREDFRRTMVARLLTRMNLLRVETEQALRAAVVGTGTAMVHVSNKLAARDAEFGRMHTSNSKSRHMSDGARASGTMAGDRVGLNRPLESNGQRRIGG